MREACWRRPERMWKTDIPERSSYRLRPTEDVDRRCSASKSVVSVSSSLAWSPDIALARRRGAALGSWGQRPWKAVDGGISCCRQATNAPRLRLLDVGTNTRSALGTTEVPEGNPKAARAGSARADAASAVSALYEAHAVYLVRLALVMTGDRPTAEDVVQDAFLGLYRRWDYLSRADSALDYLRSSVLNGCRSVFRRRRRLADSSGEGVPGASAEVTAMISEEHRQVVDALRQLPPRQRQVLALRFYLELPIPEIARTMGINQGTVKSTTSRALAALGQLLREDQ